MENKEKTTMTPPQIEASKIEQGEHYLLYCSGNPPYFRSTFYTPCKVLLIVGDAILVETYYKEHIDRSWSPFDELHFAYHLPNYSGGYAGRTIIKDSIVWTPENKERAKRLGAKKP